MLNPRLYFILDPERCGGRDPVTVARAALAGGVTLVQLRAKSLPTRRFVNLARRIVQAAGESGVPVLINDRVDVAMAAGAAGVHLGQEDMHAPDARELLGPSAVIGLTVRDADEVRGAAIDVIDYLSIGGVFASMSKTHQRDAIGLDGLEHLVTLVRRRTDKPLTAISGIDATRVTAVMERGVDGIAVISAISLADDVEAASRHLAELVNDTRRNP